MISKISKIHVWLPGLFDYKGGIQVYSAFFVQALEQVLPKLDRRIFLKNDCPKVNDLGFDAQTQFHFAGQWNTTPLHTLFFASQVLLAAILNRPDIIICGHVNFSPLAAKISNLLNIPYWVIVHGIDVWNLDDLAKINGLKSANKIISVSQYTRDRLVKEQNISPGQISLLPNTFDESKFNIAQKPKYLLEKYNLSSHQPVILTIARLSGEEGYKGYDQVIRALPEIIKAIPNVHYLIGGKGDERPRIEKLIKNLNLVNHVTLAGFIPEEELADHYNLCNLFALPSKGEGFGIVYLEAMACGKPCLGGNQDGATDALCNGELGALVDPDSIEQIAKTLISILQGTYVNTLMYNPEALRQKVINIFGFEQFKKKMHNLLIDYFA